MVERHGVVASRNVLVMKVVAVGRWETDEVAPEGDALGKRKFLFVVNVNRK